MNSGLINSCYLRPGFCDINIKDGDATLNMGIGISVHMCEQTLPCVEQEQWLPYGLVCLGTKRGLFTGVRKSPEESVRSRSSATGGPYPITAQRQLALACQEISSGRLSSGLGGAGPGATENLNCSTESLN